MVSDEGFRRDKLLIIKIVLTGKLQYEQINPEIYRSPIKEYQTKGLPYICPRNRRNPPPVILRSNFLVCIFL